MVDSSVEDRLARMEAKEEVREFIALYCSLNDRMDSIDDLIDLFQDDAVMRNAAGEHEGRAAIHAYYSSFFTERTKFARHHVMNQVITILEPGVARHQSYFMALLGRDGESKMVYGQYDDLIVKTDGRWRFKDKINDVVAPTTIEAGWAEGFGKHVALVGPR